MISFASFKTSFFQHGKTNQLNEFRIRLEAIPQSDAV